MAIDEPTDEVKLSMLKVSLDELRRFYDHMTKIHDQLRGKVLGMIVGEVAIVSFLFANGTDLSIPHDADRRVIFFTSLVFLGAAFAIFLWIISTVKWKIPHDLENSTEIYANKNYGSKLKFVEYLHDDHINMIKYCLPKVDIRTQMFNKAIYLLAAGVILLLVIKIGAPHDTKGVQHMTAGTSITKGA